MPDDITRWLAANALPLSTLSAGEPYGDLEPLRETLRDVRIVGLGESTHGTREFFLLKHRLLEFLVREMGCRALAMEASESAALAVDAYVGGAPGDAARLVSRLDFWTWRTQEVLAMVEWMREHNRTVPAAERVRFIGIDPQRCADSAAAVGAFLEKAVPSTAESVRESLALLATSRPGSRPDSGRGLYEEAVELAGLLEERRAGLAARTSPEAAAIRHARILVRCADLITRPLQPNPGEESLFAVRDRYMAEAVTRWRRVRPALSPYGRTTGTSRRALTRPGCPPSAACCAAATARPTTRWACSSERDSSGPVGGTTSPARRSGTGSAAQAGRSSPGSRPPYRVTTSRVSFHIGSAPVPKAAASAYPTAASSGVRRLSCCHSAHTRPSPTDVKTPIRSPSSSSLLSPREHGTNRYRPASTRYERRVRKPFAGASCTSAPATVIVRKPVARVPMGTWDSSGVPSALRTTALGMPSPSTISSPALPSSRTSTLPNRRSSTGM